MLDPRETALDLDKTSERLVDPDSQDRFERVVDFLRGGEPVKTISGLAGGTLAALLVSCFCNFFLATNLFTLAFLGLVLGLWGAAGDLFESAVKRAMDIKDSSNLLMGHGGFWDRLDSLLFNVVPVYVAADLIINAQ